MEITVLNRQRRIRLAGAPGLARIAREVLQRLGRGRDGLEITIVLVSDARIRALNRRFRGVDTATDVLAFPPDHLPDHLMDPPAHLGDIVISVETARRQAHDLHAELIRLLIHGLLHLLDYDHERSDAEARRMRRLETRLRRVVRPAAGPTGRLAPKGSHG